MPRFDPVSHDMLIQAGYEYDSMTDKYFNRGSPIWEVSDKRAAATKQGAWPSNSISEFRKQEREWIESEWSKILAQQSHD